jgi:hypothetical protein
MHASRRDHCPGYVHKVRRDAQSHPKSAGNESAHHATRALFVLTRDTFSQLPAGVVVEPIEVVAPLGRRLLLSADTIVATATITTTAQAAGSSDLQSSVSTISKSDLQSALTTQLSVRANVQISRQFFSFPLS